LEDAFWTLLAEQPYREMTMGALARRAGVNHNTFYYYYANLDAMAAQLLEENLVPELPARLLAEGPAGIARTITDDATVIAHFRRMCLMVGPHGAPWMAERLRQAVMALWLDRFDRDEAGLDRSDAITLTWLIGGLVAVLGRYGQDLDPAQLAAVARGPLGQGVYASLARMAADKAPAA
jgi:AcrR family transcriptional regulator